ncbi:MAG: hypothetical protein V3V84_07415 [Candidatus Bathyarchaeia archaeon]
MSWLAIGLDLSLGANKLTATTNSPVRGYHFAATISTCHTSPCSSAGGSMGDVQERLWVSA